MAKRILTIFEQKNGQVSTLPLNQVALQVLSDQSKIRQLHGDLVFFNSAGKPHSARNVLRVFYHAIKKSGIAPLRFHDLRPTFATRLTQAGIDSYTIQKLGRWQSPSMLQRYTHHSSESLRPAIEVLAQTQS